MFESEKFKQVIQAPKGRKIIRVEISDDRENLVIFSELQNQVFTQNDLNDLFPIVKASELSMKDTFLQHTPKTEKQRVLKSKIEEVIRRGISDFRRPIIDPSVDEDGNIYFKKGETPGISHSMKWWEANCKEFLSSKNSRLGNESQYYAFLAILLKEHTQGERFESIVKFAIDYGGCTEEQIRKNLISEAWDSICDNSKDIAYYCNTRNGEDWAKYGFEIQKTGSMSYGIWCDLANTVKIVKSDDTEELLFMSGCAYFTGNISLSYNSTKYAGEDYFCSTGWIVFDV